MKFLNEYHTERGCGSFELQQRVFDIRRRGIPVRSITNWGYETQLRKCIAKSPTKKMTCVHRLVSFKSKRLIVDRDVMRFNHYRGHPSQVPDRHHIKFKHESLDKIDESMLRFMDNRVRVE